MQKNSTINNEIMNMPQLKARYEALAIKIENQDKQLNKIFKILNKSVKLKMNKDEK